MFSASDFRRYADEAIRSARVTRSDDQRKHYLDMAKVWTAAASLLDGRSMIPDFSDHPLAQ
jgi:hypothetical protein